MLPNSWSEKEDIFILLVMKWKNVCLIPLKPYLQSCYITTVNFFLNSWRTKLTLCKVVSVSVSSSCEEKLSPQNGTQKYDMYCLLNFSSYLKTWEPEWCSGQQIFFHSGNLKGIPLTFNYLKTYSIYISTYWDTDLPRLNCWNAEQFKLFQVFTQMTRFSS